MKTIALICFVFVFEATVYGLSDNDCVCDVCYQVVNGLRIVVPNRCLNLFRGTYGLWVRAMTILSDNDGTNKDRCHKDPCRRLIYASEQYVSLTEALNDSTCVEIYKDNSVYQILMKFSASDHYPKTCDSNYSEQTIPVETNYETPGKETMDFNCSYRLCKTLNRTNLNKEFPDCDDKYTKRVITLLRDQFEQNQAQKNKSSIRRCLKKMCFAMLGMRGKEIRGNDASLGKAIDSDSCLRWLETNGVYAKSELVWNSRHEVKAKFFKRRSTKKDLFGFLVSNKTIRYDCLEGICSLVDPAPFIELNETGTKPLNKIVIDKSCRKWSYTAVPHLFDLYSAYEIFQKITGGNRLAIKCFFEFCNFVRMKEDSVDYDVRTIINDPRCIFWILKTKVSYNKKYEDEFI